MFESILNEAAGTLSITSAVLCMVIALILGMIIAWIHRLGKVYSKDFVITLSLLPLLVQVVIMMVNGNLGTSVAILGAFSLIRFRSMPGTSRELFSVFFAMAVGLSLGMGYITFALMFTFIISVAVFLFTKTAYGEKTQTQTLKITIPENLDYDTVFSDIFEMYTQETHLIKVKTTNMGSMYELTFEVVLCPNKKEKDMIDAIRCRNGNLNVIFSRAITDIAML